MPVHPPSQRVFTDHPPRCRPEIRRGTAPSLWGRQRRLHAAAALARCQDVVGASSRAPRRRCGQGSATPCWAGTAAGSRCRWTAAVLRARAAPCSHAPVRGARIRNRGETVLSARPSEGAGERGVSHTYGVVARGRRDAAGDGRRRVEARALRVGCGVRTRAGLTGQRRGRGGRGRTRRRRLCRCRRRTGGERPRRGCAEHVWRWRAMSGRAEPRCERGAGGRAT